MIYILLREEKREKNFLSCYYLTILEKQRETILIKSFKKITGNYFFNFK